MVVQKTVNHKAPIGRSILLRIKSSLSRIPLLPIKCTSDRKFEPRAHGIEPIRIMIKFIIIDCFLDIPLLSTQLVVIFSNTAVTVEKLANVINRKNRVPHILPPFI